ncbi:MAG: hypothetical protein PHO46_02955 [Thermoguttaceae bacterium]|nr:hypothetical protein [Thermoguttaceae bacterium]
MHRNKPLVHLLDRREQLRHGPFGEPESESGGVCCQDAQIKGQNKPVWEPGIVEPPYSNAHCRQKDG